MPKKIKLQASDLGGDISTVDIYHTSIDPLNLISSSVSASVLTDPGIFFTVEDSVVDFFAKCNDGGFCQDVTGSISASAYSPNTRYLSFGTSGSGTGDSIQMTYPSSIGPGTFFTASINYLTYAFTTVEATDNNTYPIAVFQGWYYSGSSTLLTSDSTLTVTKNTFTGSDDFVAFFKDI